MTKRWIRSRRWRIQLIVYVGLIGLTIAVLELASATTNGFLVIAAIPTLGTILMFRFELKRPANRPSARAAGNLGRCAILVVILTWSWYVIATTTASVTPVSATPSSFRVDETFGVGGVRNGCIALVDEANRLWTVSHRLRGRVKSGRITLYRTRTGWTAESHPTTSPSAFFRIAYLNEPTFRLTPFNMNPCLHPNSPPVR